ncbi:MAG: type II secretion system minor pseudopilin GspJ [Candidatus Sedimenticola endophacoides]
MRRLKQIGSRNSRGFTLLELMVAITLFSIMAAMAYGGLEGVLRTKAHTDLRAQRLAELELCLSRIQQDIEQMTDRAVRDPFGDDVDALRVMGADYVLEFTHSGWLNWQGEAKSALSRIAYHLDEGTLYRLSWPALDSVQGAEPVKQTLMNGVEMVELRFHNGSKWLTSWPPVGEDQHSALPRGIELKLSLDDWGVINRVFHIAG